MHDRTDLHPRPGYALAAGLATALAVLAGAVATAVLAAVMAIVGLKRAVSGLLDGLRHRPAALVHPGPAPREQA